MSKFYIGVDVGGTTIKIGFFDANKKLISKNKIKTVIKKSGAEKAIIDQVFEHLDYYFSINVHGITKTNIKGIGFAIPGPVVKNQVLRAVNINWKKRYDIVDACKKYFKRKINVCVINDANAAVVAEYSKTLKKKYDNICLMTLGTAIGTGIIINGKLIEGHTGIAGEICHIKVDYLPDAVKCNCGNTGCLETVVSGTGIVNIYKRLYLKKKTKDSIINVGKYKLKLSELEAMHIISAAKSKDQKALYALTNSLEYLSRMIVILMHVYEPEVILIGGGVSSGGPIITNILKKQLKNKVYITKVLPKIMLAKLKNDAGIYGVVENL